MTDFRGKTSIFSHPVYLFLRKFSLQDSRGGSDIGCLEILGASLVLKRPLPYQNWGMLQGLTCSSRIVAELAMKK
ncbi:hypothetical protein ELV09_04175 [Escherichia coli]|nr:hypothetical protein ELV09_04175 [Escherichia coli]